LSGILNAHFEFCGQRRSEISYSRGQGNRI
jgi:hypothetical protein